MITLQHSIITLLGINPKDKAKEQIEKFKKQIPYVLLPDAIRRYTGRREYSHFEENSDGSEISYMKFPIDIKHYSKERFDTTERFLSSKINPAVIGEKTHIEKFEKTNMHLPRPYYNGLKMHLLQDVTFDDFVRDIIDCSDKYDDVFKFNGQVLDGKKVRELIANIEMEGFEILAYMAYRDYGIKTNQEWFDNNVKKQLDEIYPPDLADATYSYMTIPEELNKRISENDFKDLEKRIRNNETLIPYEKYKRMYIDAITKTMAVGNSRLAPGDEELIV